MLRAWRADTKEQLWNRTLTVGRVVTANDIPAVPSRPGGPCTDIAPYYGAQPRPLALLWRAKRRLALYSQERGFICLLFCL